MILLAWGLLGCGPKCDEGCIVAEELPAGLLSVQARRADDVWIVGGPDTEGPVLLHLDDKDWTRLDTSEWPTAELWWAWVDDDEAVFVGSEGLVLELDRGTGALTAAAGIGLSTTFFGVWGASADELWAVGMRGGDTPGPALWRRTEGTWAPYQIDDLENDENDTWFKVAGNAADDAWIVGTRGRSLHYDGTLWTEVPTDAQTPTGTAPLLTVATRGDRPYAVGGAGNGLVLEYDGTDWLDGSPSFQPGLNGVCARDGAAWTVGQRGARAERTAPLVWTTDVEKELDPLTIEDWHACDLDDEGGLWMVGGRIGSRPLIRGVIGYQGDNPPKKLVVDGEPVTSGLSLGQ